MDIPIQIYEIKMGLPIIYFTGSQVGISKLWYISVLKNVLTSAKSVDPDEMPLCVAFHLSLQFLPKYQFRGFQNIKDFKGWGHKNSTVTGFGKLKKVL